jgi:hypothetical protein
LLSELVNSGQLVIVDLRTELELLYGPTHAKSVVLFSAAVYQMAAKADCLVRAKARGVRWNLHVDIDEFLFPSAGFAPKEEDYASFHEMIFAKEPRLSKESWSKVPQYFALPVQQVGGFGVAIYESLYVYIYISCVLPVLHS